MSDAIRQRIIELEIASQQIEPTQANVGVLAEMGNTILGLERLLDIPKRGPAVAKVFFVDGSFQEIYGDAA